jgi:hypothetical protein
MEFVKMRTRGQPLQLALKLKDSYPTLTQARQVGPPPALRD